MEVGSFEVMIEGQNVAVREFKIGKQHVYRLELPQRPLVITRAVGEDRGHFWTSIPEGRQEEADRLGIFIDQYLNR